VTRLALVSEHPLPQPTTAGARTLRIGDLAKATSKTQRALRLYEELGLLTPSDRTSGGFRLYGSEAIERVAWIGKLQELGFTLHEIQGLVQVLHEQRIPRAAMAHVRGLFLEKLDDVAAQIARLSQLQRELMSSLTYLEACAGCSTESHAHAPGAVSCTSCTEHGAEAPSLVEQTRKTAVLTTDVASMMSSSSSSSSSSLTSSLRERP
jgi:MerR family copper efflux transcriptional regulator